MATTFLTKQGIVHYLKGMISYDCNQSKLAIKLGVSNGHLSNVLAGKADPCEKIIKALGYEPLFGKVSNWNKRKKAA